MSAPAPRPGLVAVEAFFRRSGLPHLTVEDRMGDSIRRWRRPAMIAAWIALGILVPVLDVRWWVGVVVALAIPALAAALSYLLVDLGVLALFVHRGRAGPRQRGCARPPRWPSAPCRPCSR